ncbi:MAG: ATP-binding protein [Rhodopila sp.]
MTDGPNPLLPELERLDRLIAHEIKRLRARYELTLDEFRGLYISDEQVDALVRARHGEVDRAAEPRPPLAEGSAWARLIRRFRLGPVDRDVLLVAVAPELDRKYETLFAYLNNEVGRRWPSADLIGRLIGDGLSARRVLSPAAILVRSGLIEPVPDTTRRSEAAREFAAVPAVGRFLLGLDPASDAALRLHGAAPGDAGPLTPMQRLAQAEGPPLLALEGMPGSGRLRAACAFAAAVGRRVLEADLNATTRPAEDLLREAGLVARLENAILFVRGLDEPSPSERLTKHRLAAGLDMAPGPVLVAVASGASPGDAFGAHPFVRIVWPQPDPQARHQLWTDALAADGYGAEAATLEGLAERFRLTPPQIARAARAATVGHAIDGNGGSTIAGARLFGAAREQSGDALDGLAARITRQVDLRDLVLPAATLSRLRDVASAVANRGLVQRQWGMGRLSLSPDGLAVLFQGASGTGKTMAASAVAGELGLDLYRIELAGVVSKYIGETEKNIDRIFRAARRCNAILLFDEADALFGKRSEVKDAHDRYANLEVAYLLQRMEEHDGPVILATNLAKNIDQAFARRLHYVVEFPRPNQAAREQLWRQMLAPPLPCAGDVDIEHLAGGFDLTGGEIRKVALEAAFMAAADGRVVTMAHAVGAAARTLQQQGRVVSARPIGTRMLMAEGSS